MKKIIGIDLGTTNSLVCIWKDGKAELIPNAFGEYLTPSVVGYDDNGTVYVGKTAKERLITHPDKTFEFFKRSMGDNKKFGKYTAEELSSFVLRSLKEDAEAYLGEKIDEAVISVPAYFNDRSRKATKNAGALAGLKVERIINEPSAAALGYLRGNGQDNLDYYEDRCILVFDFGGGTLDVSLVDTFDNVVEIISVSGDNMLGGIDFDRAIANHFLSCNKIDRNMISLSSYNLLLECAEKVKKELSEKASAVMHVHIKEIQGDLEISSKELVSICADVLKRIYRPLQEVLNNSERDIKEITDVVMVGGSSKMPMVKHYVGHVLNGRNISVINPDQSIAIGMGVYAGIKERDEEIKNVILTDVCPFSLGVAVHNEKDPSRLLSSFIISRNTALPVSKTEVYSPVSDNQKKGVFRVFQGEYMYFDSNTCIGEIELEYPEEMDTNTNIFVTFSYDLNGILVVDVEVPQFNITKQKVIVDKKSNYTDEYLAAKVEELENVKMLSHSQQEDSQIMEWAERLFAQCIDDKRDELSRKIQFYAHSIKNEKDIYQKIRIRNYMRRYLVVLEMALTQFHSQNGEIDNSWMNDEDKMIEDIFKDWDGNN